MSERVFYGAVKMAWGEKNSLGFMVSLEWADMMKIFCRIVRDVLLIETLLGHCVNLCE